MTMSRAAVARLGASAAVLLVLAWGPRARAQSIPVNYDEAKVGSYVLPDPLVLENGRPVRDRATWHRRRRPEILKLFEDQIYGRSPGRPNGMTFEVFEQGTPALDGKALRRQVTVRFFGKNSGPKMDILIYLPAAARKPVPLFLTLNFSGNHRISADPGVRIGDVWDRTKKQRSANPQKAGTTTDDWPIEKVLARGYGLATIYYCDIEPDFAGGMQYGVRPLYFKPGQTGPAPDEWGALAVWGWGLSRAMDYLETDRNIDARRVAILGQSRLGKTVLWAGARDTRFAMVIASCSGEGGAALAHRDYGETAKHMAVNFGYQFCGNYQKYQDSVDRMPVDQHELIALIAPRPVYLSTGSEDQWSDPKGEFLAAMAAGPAYRLLGKQGLDTDQMPALDRPIIRTIAFHCHTGKHEITAFDWQQYLTFADMHLRAAGPN
jgi:hypothetical protein